MTVEQEYTIGDTIVRRAQQQQFKNQVSWSRQGQIAYSPPTTTDGHNLLMTYLECVNGNTWQLAPPSGFTIPTYESYTSNKSLDLTYVCFGTTGWDLFTADSNGHVTISVTGIKNVFLPDIPAHYVSSTSHSSTNAPTTHSQASPPINNHAQTTASQYTRTPFNTLEIFYTDSTQLPLPDLSTPKKRSMNQIISMKWLYIEKPVIANFPAVRTQQTGENPVINGCAAKSGAAHQDASGFSYTFNAHQYKSYGAMHPLSAKQACIGVRRNGEVWLWHQEEHGIEYKRVISRLPFDNKDEEILNAAIGFQRDGKVIISAYFALAKAVRFFEVTINWTYFNEAVKLLVKLPNYKVPDNERVPPTLQVTKIFSVDVDNYDPECSILTNLDIVSPNYHSSSSLEVFIGFENQRSFNKDPVKSSLYRFTLDSVAVKEKLHLAFSSIGSKRGIDVSTLPNVNTVNPYDFKFQQKLEFNESILSLEPLNTDTIISLSFANGELVFLDRSNFQIIKNQYNETQPSNPLLPNTINTLLDAGFEFPKISFQPKFTAISPNICCYVSLPLYDSNLHLSVIKSQINTENLPPKKKGFLLATTIAIALRHTSACYFGYNTDDLIAAIKMELWRSGKLIDKIYPRILLVSILQECQRAINLNIDITSDQNDKMAQNQPLQRILTLQLSLGTNKNWIRNKSGRISLALVNLRFAATSLMYSIHTIYSNMQRLGRKGLSATDTLVHAKAREDCIISMVGIIRWCLDYTVAMNQEMFEMTNVFKRKDPKEIEKFIQESVMIPLILGKVPRAFLLLAISNTRKLFSFIQKFVEKNDSSLTSLITPENPMGAFKIIEKQLIVDNTASSISSKQTNAASLGGASAGVNNNNNGGTKDLISQPTTEAYYRMGALINNCPVPLHLFEKFLVEADIPLRNIRLDPASSLALEQQIVCQGHVSLKFTENLRNLANVYDKTMLNNNLMDITDLYFYDTLWLKILNSNPDTANNDGDVKLENYSDDDDDEGLDASISKELGVDNSPVLQRTNYKLSQLCNKKLIEINSYDGLVLDNLRKQLLKPSEYFQLEETPQQQTTNAHKRNHSTAMSAMTAEPPDQQSNNATNGNIKLCMRKCVRCGGVSSIVDEISFVPHHPSILTNPVFQHHQRSCFCGGSWASL